MHRPSFHQPPPKSSSQQPFLQTQVTSFNCYFSQICEISHSELQSKSITSSENMNCFVSYSEREIFIISRGGTKFQLPVDQQITKISPMVEGLLIQFKVKPQIKFHEILYYQNNKDKMEIEQSNGERQPKQLLFDSSLSASAQYCYATLTRHPYNPLKALGEYNPNHNSHFNTQSLNNPYQTTQPQMSSSYYHPKPQPWLKTPQQIIHICPNNLPLIVTYNKQLKRNAFHLLIGNISEVNQQYQYAFQPTLTYSLQFLHESPHHEVLTNLLFEETIESEPIEKVVLNKSIKKGFIWVYAMIATADRPLLKQQQKSSMITMPNENNGSSSCEIKVYEMDLLGTVHNSTKLIRRISTVRDIAAIELFNPLGFTPKVYESCYQSPSPSHTVITNNTYHPQQQQQQQSTSSPQYTELVFEILFEQIAQLKEAVCIWSGDGIEGDYYQGEMVKMARKGPSSKSLPNYNTNKEIITDPFDCLVLRSLQLCCIHNQGLFINLLTKYSSGVGLLQQVLTDFMISGSSSSSNLNNSSSSVNSGSTTTMNYNQPQQQQQQQKYHNLELFHYLHVLYQELKLYELMKEERKKLGNIMIVLSEKLSKREYVDYYQRQGFSVGVSKTVQGENKSSESWRQVQTVYDVFEVLDQILYGKISSTPSSTATLSSSFNPLSSKLQPILCLYSRSEFILRFFHILINGTNHSTMNLNNQPNTSVFGMGNFPTSTSTTSATIMHPQLFIESLCKQHEGINRLHHGNEYLYKSTRFPLLSQKVYHLEYYNRIYEEQLLLNVPVENKEQEAFIFLIKNYGRNNENSTKTSAPTKESLETYPMSVRVVFNYLLREMRKNLPFSLYEVIPRIGFTLIHRQDLYKNIQLYSSTRKKSTSHIPYHIQKPSFDDHIKTLIHTSNSEEYFLTSNASQMNKINNDLVFEEVDRLLSSTSEIKIRVKDLQSIPQNKWQEQASSVLLKLANRKLSVVIGQGAFSLATSTSFITDVIKIPKINLGGVMPSDIKIALDLKDDKQSIVHWPEFHSGIVAGLKLSRHVIPLSEDHLKTWIFYQKPDTPRRDHSGFLLSLGLLGYLKCFSPGDIYQYLKPNNQFTSIAILLGTSASNISNGGETMSRALFLHIPALLPANIDVEIPINVQTSALVGLGLIHKGSCNRTITETVLSQIGKKPTSDKCIERQGYSLAAGWALGMICLGMRGKKQSFRDLQIEERLIRFIEGGKKMDPPQSMTSNNYINNPKSSNIKEGPNVNLHVTAPAALLAISLMYLKSNNAELASRISIPNSFSMIEDCNPNHILLKTLAKNLIMWDDNNNITSSSSFRSPNHNQQQTHHRNSSSSNPNHKTTPNRQSKQQPNQPLHRPSSSASPSPSAFYQHLIQQHVPELIQFIYHSPLNKVYQRYYLVYNVSQIDYQTVTSIYLNVMTGTILSLGFKYAGTGNQLIYEVIKEHLEHLKHIKILKSEFVTDPMNKNCIDQYELFQLLGTTIISMSMVMCGTCDIDCLKVIRVIRKKFQDNKVFHYGFNMIINMAIGFLFLGYGNYTFNREDLSIAALLIAVYPQYPNSPNENRWHLQALRHFYVLAMEEKIFHAVDVDTNKVVNVNVEMEFGLIANGGKGTEGSGKGNADINNGGGYWEREVENVQTPVLLQENKKLLQVRIRDSDYFDVDFDFGAIATKQGGDAAKQQPKAIYIKRKHFKDVDPKYLNPENPLVTETISKTVKDALSQEVRYTAMFNSDLQTQSFSNSSAIDVSHLSYIIKNPSNNNNNSSSSNSNAKLLQIQQKIQQNQPQVSKDLYYRLLKEDKLDTLEIYLTLKQQLRRFIDKMAIVVGENGSSSSKALHFANRELKAWSGNGISDGIQNDSLLLNNVALLLNFEQKHEQGLRMEFRNLVADEIKLLQNKLLKDYRDALTDYYWSPFSEAAQKEQQSRQQLRKADSTVTLMYQLLELFRIPQSRQLLMLKEALGRLRQFGKEDSMDTLCYMCHPETSFECLNAIMRTLKEAK